MGQKLPFLPYSVHGNFDTQCSLFGLATVVPAVQRKENWFVSCDRSVWWGVVLDSWRQSSLLGC